MEGLKHLSIMSPENFKCSASVDDTPLAMRLTSLSLWLFSEDGAPTTSGSFLSALFTASSETLKTLRLRLYNAVSEKPVHNTFHIIGPGLRTLILESAHDVFDEHLDLFGTCNSLSDLRISCCNAETINAIHLGAILDALPSPPTLRSLSIDVFIPKYLSSFLPLLENMATSLLERLSFQRLPTMWSEDPLVGAMEAACEARGIQMIYGG